MPIYEFECNDCHEIFEVIVSTASKAGQVNCKKCSSSNVKKTISAGSFRVGKGSSVTTIPSAGGCGNRRSPFT